MARLPSALDLGERPVPRPQRGVVSYTPQDGAGLIQGGKALAAVGADMMEEAERRKKTDDAMAVQNAYVKAAEQARLLLRDPDKGLLNRQGADALNGNDEAAKRLGEIGAATAEGLSAEQKKAFDRLWSTRREGWLDTVATHVSGERKAYHQQTVKAMTQSAIDDAINFYDDPKAVARAETLGVSALRLNGQALGMSPEAIEADERNLLSAIHGGVVERLAVHDPGRARAYYAGVRDKIDGKDHTRIEKMLEEGSTRAQGQAWEDRIWSQTGGDLATALEAARGIADPKVRDDVVSRVKMRHSEAKAIEAEAEKGLRSQAWDVLLKGGKVDDIPLNVWSEIDAPAQKALVEYAAKKGKVQTDWSTYYRLERQAVEDPAGFAAYDLLQHRHQLDEGEFKGLVTLQREIGQKGRDSEQLTQVRTVSQVINSSLDKLGIERGENAPKSDAEKGDRFHRLVQDELLSLERREGRKAKPDEVQAIADRMVLDVVVPGKLWGTNEKAPVDIEIGDVPKTERSKIEEALKRAGRPVSEAAIVDLYALKLSRSNRQ
jgi:hypothetical protein